MALSMSSRLVNSRTPVRSRLVLEKVHWPTLAIFDPRPFSSSQPMSSGSLSIFMRYLPCTSDGFGWYHPGCWRRCPPDGERPRPPPPPERERPGGGRPSLERDPRGPPCWYDGERRSSRLSPPLERSFESLRRAGGERDLERRGGERDRCRDLCRESRLEGDLLGDRDLLPERRPRDRERFLPLPLPLPLGVPLPAQETFTKGMPKSFCWSVPFTASSASRRSEYCTKANAGLPLLQRIWMCLMLPYLSYSSLMAFSVIVSGRPPIHMRDSSPIVAVDGLTA
mmetsp:Transcript_59645/g.158605  ORF Transcript_59645/g.158605 Transcript_59645/m.158605 type:complete len:282 (+) Transcript_59645:339-1184(+)